MRKLGPMPRELDKTGKLVTVTETSASDDH
ncbi:Protein of unknown function [Pyronema omphalodes CBS 100304]|uniref:Uncharacterized protein n=1 Tax=Pyronema omphalodes (strain CBS 100304) TaxID=1076935 RepID=U4L1G7_PYROM|nr:Protein of unknown function [Pyronema omphalodes CBS 100304]